MVIIETSTFTHQVQAMLSDEDYRLLQTALINRPDLGKVIPGCGGLRKVRWMLPGKGKRGSVRIIYYWAVAQERLLMLFLYSKSERDDLTPVQLKILKSVIKDEFP